MGRYCCRIDRFSAGLDELTRKQQASTRDVLRCLDEIKQFSIFEATANQVIAGTMDRLVKCGFITVTPRGYPWSDVVLTEDGRNRLEKE